jgi:hypothetical protein
MEKVSQDIALAMKHKIAPLMNFVRQKKADKSHQRGRKDTFNSAPNTPNAMQMTGITKVPIMTLDLFVRE